jgi:hypothetical protein
LLTWNDFDGIMVADSGKGWFWVILKNGSKLQLDSDDDFLKKLGVTKNESEAKKIQTCESDKPCAH